METFLQIILIEKIIKIHKKYNFFAKRANYQINEEKVILVIMFLQFVFPLLRIHVKWR